jgi:hypothetical protein
MDLEALKHDQSIKQQKYIEKTIPHRLLIYELYTMAFIKAFIFEKASPNENASSRNTLKYLHVLENKWSLKGLKASFSSL